MDLKVIILMMVTMWEVRIVAALRSVVRHRRAKTITCEMEWYFDPHIGANGRCQPCREICDPRWGTEDQCLANMNQCRGTYEKYHPTTTSTVMPSITEYLTSTLTTESEKQQSQTILIVAIATGFVAMVTILLLAGYLYKRNGKSFKNCCRSCMIGRRLVKPVIESSPHVSREEICVSGVNNPLTSVNQALLVKYGQEESNSLGHYPESVV